MLDTGRHKKAIPLCCSGISGSYMNLTMWMSWELLTRINKPDFPGEAGLNFRFFVSPLCDALAWWPTGTAGEQFLGMERGLWNGMSPSRKIFLEVSALQPATQLQDFRATQLHEGKCHSFTVSFFFPSVRHHFLSEATVINPRENKSSLKSEKEQPSWLDIFWLKTCFGDSSNLFVLPHGDP